MQVIDAEREDAVEQRHGSLMQAVAAGLAHLAPPRRDDERSIPDQLAAAKSNYDNQKILIKANAKNRAEAERKAKAWAKADAKALAKGPPPSKASAAEPPPLFGVLASPPSKAYSRALSGGTS